MIRDSRPGVQMPAFKDKLSEKSRSSSSWPTRRSCRRRAGEAEIRASRVVHKKPESATSLFDADPLNLFVVVEAGDHHVTILDGDRLEPIRRFASRFALHGGPKFSPDGRYVYFASRDGWITKYDLWGLETLVEVRAGINTRNAAVSSDGKYVIVANYLPHSVTIFDRS